MIPDQPAGPPLSEAVLARLWAGQRFPESALVTADGVPLRVLHPGIAGRGAGPDFRDAIIAARGRLLRGDVELHQRSSDFIAHRHGGDPRYDGLILHVVFSDDAREPTRVCGGARRVPVVALASWLERRTRELAGWLAAPALWREPCHDALARLGAERVRKQLAALGDSRFAAREAVLREAIAAEGAGQALYRALLEGLGYGGDRALLAAVADALPWPRLAGAIAADLQERIATIEALLTDGARRAGASGRGQAVRPANQPQRRLAGLAALLVRHERLFAEGGAPAEALAAPARQLIASWSVPASGRWRERAGGALVGRGRAVELLVNAVLPWAAAAAAGRGEEDVAAAARAAFARLPAPARYGRLAFLEANLGVRDRALGLDARTQQGLLALYKTECTQGGCGRCVLSEERGTGNREQGIRRAPLK